VALPVEGQVDEGLGRALPYGAERGIDLSIDNGVADARAKVYLQRNSVGLVAALASESRCA
jgi:hypothetical protein